MPPAITAKIDAQRRRLQCAAVLFECTAVAYDAGRDLEFSDGMPVVRELVEGAVRALDSVELRRPPSKVNEDDD